MKIKLLAGNWKMNHGQAATRQFLSSMELTPKSHAIMRIYPSPLSLELARNIVKERGLALEIGAQNLHSEKAGAFTGEISGPMLNEIGIHQVLVGHSERRQYFGETNEEVLKKTLSALDQGFEVLACIGESLSERKSGKTNDVLRSQLEPLLNHPVCQSHFSKKLHIAYEPVWAIGTGVVATPQEAEDAHFFIRQQLSSYLGEAQANAVRILYGGSVTPSNFKDLLSCPNIDGGLVGGASLKLDSWMALWNLI